MAKAPKTLRQFMAAELVQSARPEATAFAKSLAGEFNGATLAVLYYGSCLRTGKIKDMVLDFYVLVSDYKSAHRHALSALGNALVPPNVYYREIRFKGHKVRAKVAVLSLKEFEKRVSPEGLNVSVWARFAQPSRLLFAKNAKIRARVIDAVAKAPKTMVSQVLPLVFLQHSPADIWIEGLRRTYGAEFRSEDRTKARELYTLNEAYYKTLTPLVLEELSGPDLLGPKALAWRWRLRTLTGKIISLLRLIKAVFTFQGGIDYLAWKIKRSSGVEVEIKPWHRKLPLLAGIILFIRLRLKGAFR